MTTSPKVSVCIITYNHGKYIEQALLSALTQRTNFEFEVIVSDDASTDETLQVIRKVAARYPQLRVMAHPQNLGGSGGENYLAVHNEARGEYVAHLDGDDFWLPGKLQAQANVLDAHPEYAVAWHPLIAFDEAGSHYIIGDHGDLVRTLFRKDYVELPDAMLAYGITGYHSSCMYRRDARSLFEYPITRLLLDYRISLSLLERGAGYHMKRPLGCYRAFHDSSATRGGRDLVGPGLLHALSDYAGSHPELRRLIAAHCAASFFNRTRFQARLVGILLSRLAGRSKTASGGAAKQLLQGNISLERRLLGQLRYAANSLNILGLGARQAVLPEFGGVRRAVNVTTYLGRQKQAKPGFFQKRYGARLAMR